MAARNNVNATPEWKVHLMRKWVPEKTCTDVAALLNVSVDCVRRYTREQRKPLSNGRIDKLLRSWK